jgi:chromosome segregation ATPase
VKRWLWLLLLPGLAGGADGAAPQAYLYRYHNADGTLALSATLSQQAIHSGYQMLDANGRVIKSVPAAPPEAQARRRAELKAQRQAEARARQDEALKRLYAGPGDAERARERRLDALRLKIGYTENNLERQQDKLDQEIHNAAQAERGGRPVSENTRAAIDRYSRQIRESRENVAEYRQDMEAVRVQYQPIIERLRELEKVAGTAGR